MLVVGSLKGQRISIGCTPDSAGGFVERVELIGDTMEGFSLDAFK